MLGGSGDLYTGPPGRLLNGTEPRHGGWGCHLRAATGTAERGNARGSGSHQLPLDVGVEHAAACRRPGNDTGRPRESLAPPRQRGTAGNSRRGRKNGPRLRSASSPAGMGDGGMGDGRVRLLYRTPAARDSGKRMRLSPTPQGRSLAGMAWTLPRHSRTRSLSYARRPHGSPRTAAGKHRTLPRAPCAEAPAVPRPCSPATLPGSQLASLGRKPRARFFLRAASVERCSCPLPNNQVPKAEDSTGAEIPVELFHSKSKSSFMDLFFLSQWFRTFL